MSDGASADGRRAWLLPIAFVFNILVVMFLAWSAYLVINLLHCFNLFERGCDPWTSHIGSSLLFLAGPALALVGTICGTRFARRDEPSRAVRALLGWSAVALGVFMLIAAMGPT